MPTLVCKTLEGELLDLVGRARPLITDKRKAQKWQYESEAWCHVWRRHVQEGERLRRSAQALRAG